jgi:hypothetical protein
MLNFNSKMFEMKSKRRFKTRYMPRMVYCGIQMDICLIQNGQEATETSSKDISTTKCESACDISKVEWKIEGHFCAAIHDINFLMEVVCGKRSRLINN